MDIGSTAAGSTGAAARANRENIQAYESKMKYTVSAKPLDFSFMKTLHYVALVVFFRNEGAY